MFTDRNGIEWRNLMEQVELNQADIQNLLTGVATLAEFGLKVINVSEDGTPPVDPPELELGDDTPYGYSWLVRINPGDNVNPAAYNIYIWTRIDFNTDASWINFGEFPKRGPQGFVGPQGAVGPPGATGTTGTRGTITYFQNNFPSSGMIVGDQLLMTTFDLYRWTGSQWTLIGNIKGPQGAQGAQGEQGFTPYIQGGYWYINNVNTGVKAEGVDGSSITIQSGTYTVASLPNFSATNTGDAFYVTDDPTYPQGALYFNGAGGTTWTIIPWDAEAGPSGPPGPAGEVGPSGPPGPAGEDAAIVYDLVIRTQAEFEALIADPTWFDAKSVAFVGQFTLSTRNNSGVKRPANVTRIDGYNNAKITVTNFAYNSATAKGGLWDDGNANNPRCYINNLNVECQAINGDDNSYGYGFNGNNNTYTNCTGTGTSNIRNGYGFNGDDNIHTNCTGSGTSYSTGTGAGSYGYGFSGRNNTYTACTGTGSGNNSYGFYSNNNRIISCTALAYILADKTPSDINCVPIRNGSTSTNLFMIIKDCKFPQIAKAGYQQGTIWCNIANNATMVGSIKDNVYHSRFTVTPIKGPNVVADNNSAVDITAI